PAVPRDDQGARHGVAEVQEVGEASLRRAKALEGWVEPGAVGADAVGRGGVLHGDEDEPSARPLEGTPELQEVRKLRLAGEAPGGPQVDEGGPIGDRFQGNGPAVGGDDRE